MSDEPGEDARPKTCPYPSALDKSAQEHLGKELRGLYNVLADKPTYLGESVIPAGFDVQLNRLARRVIASEAGAAAVSEALESPSEHPSDKPQEA
jgi:hypothetical protein